jgi:hypothetical protein
MLFETNKEFHRARFDYSAPNVGSQILQVFGYKVMVACITGKPRFPQDLSL